MFEINYQSIKVTNPIYPGGENWTQSAPSPVSWFGNSSVFMFNNNPQIHKEMRP